MAKDKELNFSPAATRRKVLTSKRNTLMNSIEVRVKDRSVVVSSAHPAAKIHNEGGTFKVFGKHTATMPKRQFMGHSKVLDKIIEKEFTE